MTGFYMKCSIGLNWVKQPQLINLSLGFYEVLLFPVDKTSFQRLLDVCTTSRTSYRRLIDVETLCVYWAVRKIGQIFICPFAVRGVFDPVKQI